MRIVSFILFSHILNKKIRDLKKKKGWKKIQFRLESELNSAKLSLNESKINSEQQITNYKVSISNLRPNLAWEIFSRLIF